MTKEGGGSICIPNYPATGPQFLGGDLARPVQYQKGGYLRDYQTAGVTADRLLVGGQTITRFLEYGTPGESGLIYIDAQGVGHNPF